MTGIPTTAQAVIDAINAAAPELEPVDLAAATAELGQVTALLDAIAPTLDRLRIRQALATEATLDLTRTGGKDSHGHMRNIPVSGVGMFHRENKETKGKPKYKELYEYLYSKAAPANKAVATKMLARMTGTVSRGEKLVRGEAPAKTTKKGWTGPMIQPESELIEAEKVALSEANLTTVIVEQN